MRESKPADQPDNSPTANRSLHDFEHFFKENYAFVHRALTRSTGPDCADVDDLAQEVFLVAMDRFQSFDGTSKPTTWLYGIAWRVASQYRRKQALRRWFSLDGDAQVVVQHSQEPDRQLAGIEDRKEVYAILDKMSDKKRQTLILYELEGYTGEEIAQIMDCNESTVWTRLHYAREEFKERAIRRVSGRGRADAGGRGTRGGRA